MDRPPPALTLAWRGALLCFVLAGLTGVAYRFALVSGYTAGFSTVNLRHAHSHLMFFGWVTPALFALIAVRLPAITGRPAPRGLGAVVAGLFATALAAFALFARYGYGSAGGVPLSTIASTSAMFVWYGLAAVYARWTWGVRRTPALRRFDAAIAVLVASTLGAWGLAALVPSGLHATAWGDAAKHLFLDTFAHGWLLLGVLGLARPRGPAPRTVPPMLLGMPGLVGLSLPGLPFPLLLASGALGIVFAGALAVEVLDVARRAPAWRLPMAAAGLVAVGLAVGALRPDLALATQPGLRLLYLHVLLLGAVSLGLVTAARGTFEPAPSPGVLGVAVAGVVLTLVPFTPLSPVTGSWALTAALVAAVVPPLVVAASLLPRRPALQES